MKGRHWLLVVAVAVVVWANVIARSLTPIIHYGRDELFWSGIVAVCVLAAWTALEVTAQVLAARTPRCRCGCALGGLRCPECSRTVGEGGPRSESARRVSASVPEPAGSSESAGISGPR